MLPGRRPVPGTSEDGGGMSGAFRLHSAAMAKHRKSKEDREFPVSVTRPDPLAWQQALRVAGGDASRLHVEPDGSVIVANRPRKRGSYA